MEIIPIYPPYIYSIRYDDMEENEFDRLFDLWNDVLFVTDFLTENSGYLTNPVWSRVAHPEDAARQVLREAEDLEGLFEELAINTDKGEMPDFDSHFKYLEGDYKYELKLVPMKSYGTERPSLLRIYAIRLQQNTYLITGGGIKLADTIQNSPDLRDHVLPNLGRVRGYLKANGIIDREDMD